MQIQTLPGVVAVALAAAVPPASGAYPPEIKPVSIESSADGTDQPALFYKPPGAGKVPLLVALHPWSSDWKNGQNIPLAKGCIERGWAFIHPNFRGPNRTPAACGSDLAVTDVKDAVAWAKREHGIDPDRVYLAGVSGGGHMTLLMAGRAPELWAAASSWVPIADCAAWHAECTKSGRKYARDLELSCGGKPGDSDEVDREYQRRSPLTWLVHARGLPVSINAGITDGHTGSVPISHTLNAFNILADKAKRLSQDQIDHFTSEAAVPESLSSEKPARIEAFGDRQPLWRRKSGKTEVTIFDGGHEMVPDAIFEFFSRVGKRR